MKQLLLLIFAIFPSLGAMAQQSGDQIMIYHDGSVSPYTYEINAIDHITYSNEGATQQLYLKGNAGSPAMELTVSNIDSVVFSVYHNPADDIVLADLSANKKVKRLYYYLKANYATKCFSAAMANVNWNHVGADKVYNITGKYPAINGYDYIHINWSGKSSWINYDNITPVKEWADAGGIVSLMWHFNVPKTETSDSTDATCTPSETTFRCKNIFTAGTWEHKWFYKEMDKVCSSLLKLQNAGIVALWRPFHEAAGNYYATAWKGTAWFWWGYDGPTYYKQLWKTMFDYFQAKGIHNLIWIWTAQHRNCNASQYGDDYAFYPGDQYVDIVGRDPYGYTVKQATTDYVDLTKLYPGKLITMAECGNSVNGTTINAHQALISSQWSGGAKWLYFMPWYDYNYENGTTTTNYMCDTSFWTDAMSQSYVVDRSQVNY